RCLAQFLPCCLPRHRTPPTAIGYASYRLPLSFSRDCFRRFLPQPLYLSGGPRRGFTLGLPAHRSFGQKKYGAVRKEKKEGPYILGLKTPRLYGHPVNDWASNPWEPAVTLPCRSAPATPSRARQQVAFPARTSPERKIVS